MMKKRIISAILSIVLVFGLASAFTLNAEAATHAQAEAVVENALKYASSGKSIGVMCAGMVCKAAKDAAVDSGQMNLSATIASPYVGKNQFGFIKSDGSLAYGCKAYTWKDFVDGNYTPQIGDLVFYGYMTTGGGTSNKTIKQVAQSGDYYHVHVGIIRNNNSTTSKLYTVDGGQSSSSGSGSTYVKTKDRTVTADTGYVYTQESKKIYVMEFVRPNYLILYSVQLFNNYSGKNYMPVVEAGNFPSVYESRDTSVATISCDSSVKRVSDCNTLKIVNSSAGSSGKDLIFRANTCWRAVDEAYSFNQTMTLSFWAKASNPGVKMYFRWGYQDTSEAKSVTFTDDWAYYTLRMDRTTEMNNVIHPYVDGAGTVWISELQLEEGSTATSFAAEDGGRLEPLTATSNWKYVGLPTPSRAGYTFNGWYTKPNGGTRINNNDAVLPGDIRLFAHWTQNGYTVSYDANGGSGAPATQIKTPGVALTLSSAEPYPHNFYYSFRGWAASPDADVAYAPGATYTNDENITLYAVWHVHDFSEQVASEQYLASAATCTEAARYYYSCECGEPGMELPSLYRAIWELNGCVGECNPGTFAYGAPLGHTGGTANCAHKAVCTRCGSEYGELNAANHVGGTEIRNQKAATCVQAGNTGDICCKSCGGVLTKGTTIKALGHNFTDGICTRCGAADPDYDQGEAKIKVDTVRGTAGKTVKVKIKAENNPGIVSMTLNVTYDPSVLTLVSVTDQNLIPNAMHTTKYTSPYKLTWENDTATSNFTASGVLVELEFRIAENTEQGEYPIVVSTVKDGIYNVDADDVSFSMVNGAVVVSSVLPGDVNGDGEVTNKDRLLLSRYLANWEGYDESSIDMLAADVNCDGEVTNKDRLILSRYLANWAGYETLPMI